MYTRVNCGVLFSECACSTKKIQKHNSAVTLVHQEKANSLGVITLVFLIKNDNGNTNALIHKNLKKAPEGAFVVSAEAFTRVQRAFA